MPMDRKRRFRATEPAALRPGCVRRGKTEVVIRTGAGLKTCRLTSRQGVTFEFEADMGEPVVAEELEIEVVGCARSGDECFDGQSAFCNLRRTDFRKAGSSRRL